MIPIGIFRKAISIVVVCLTGTLSAQDGADIPLGTWRGHFSFNKLIAVATSTSHVFACGAQGLLALNKDDFSLSTITSVNGLTGVGVTCLAANSAGDLVLLGYESGRLNIIREGKIIPFDRFERTSAISGSRSVNRIAISGDVAYLATDFGITVFDLTRLEIKDTYRDLGSTGSNLKIFDTALVNDSLFAATERGVIGCALQGVNLLDYRSWKRYDQEPFAQPVSSLAVFANQLYAAIDGQGIYKRVNGQWQLQTWLQGVAIKSMSASSGGLVVATASQVVTADLSGIVSTVNSALVTSPAAATRDEDGIYWIADGKNGLVSNASGAFEKYLPNGPSTNQPWRAVSELGTTVMLLGGYETDESPLRNPGVYDRFKAGVWSDFSVGSVEDLSDVSTTSGITYFASFGHGLISVSNDQISVFDETNSPLINSVPPQRNVLVTAIENSAFGLWVANYNASLPLHLLKTDQTWESFDLQVPQAQFPVDIKVDLQSRPWLRMAPTRGGGVLVYDPGRDQSRYFTSTVGAGGLPTNDVRSLAIARDGSVWFGTAQGIAYITADLSLNAGADVIKPIFENRFLLSDEVVTAIATDAGNRKWVGTQNGVWLFDERVEQIVYRFDMQNSPLPSNRVTGISIDATSGEVFFTTENGTVSFRSDATEGKTDFSGVKIFPNPALRDFSGPIAITGLYDNARIKITDIGGKLVWETQANGGTASWNARTTNGDRVPTGMYLVFAISPDGNETHVGKIAVVN
ncbi:MAG: two-component regulator propeller domain-containing protein [Cyclobacteriaceae bacterium]